MSCITTSVGSNIFLLTCVLMSLSHLGLSIGITVEFDVLAHLSNGQNKKYVYAGDVCLACIHIDK